MKKKRPTILLDTDAYLADTGHLSTTQHGAYLLILMAVYRSSDGYIPGDDVYLARCARLTLDKWNRIASTIRALLITKGDRVTQKRAFQELRGGCQNPSQNPSQNPGKGAKSLNNKEAGPDSAHKTEKVSTEKEKPPLTTLTLLSDSDSEIQESKKKKGRAIPENWNPSDRSRLYGRTTLGFDDQKIDRCAEQMRRWAISNAHRAIAKKSNWDLTFDNWMDREAERSGPRVSGNPQSLGSGSRGRVTFGDMAREAERILNGK